jgi:hypothetical protein
VRCGDESRGETGQERMGRTRRISTIEDGNVVPNLETCN